MTPDLPGAAHSPRWVLVQQPPQQRLAMATQLHARREAQLLPVDVLVRLIVVLASEWRGTRHELVQQNAQLPPVDRGVVAILIKHIRCEVLRGPNKRGSLAHIVVSDDWLGKFLAVDSWARVCLELGSAALTSIVCSQVEIGEHDVPRVMHQHILRLEVTVQKAVGVEVLECGQDLGHVEASFILRQTVAGLRPRERHEFTPAAELEYKV
mmetsp:Transcript_4109/g.13224  ORF Transcript_4109/g.13224 Transcript_4109/m.13224 type:complete len:210 (-) Transcript_4109:285-914(-)